MRMPPSPPSPRQESPRLRRARFDSGSTRPRANAAAAPRTPSVRRARHFARRRGSRRRHSSREETPLSRRETPRTVASSRGASGTRDGVSGGSSRNAGGSGDGDRGDGNHGDGDHGDGDEAPGDGASGDDGDRGDGNHGDGYDAPGAHEGPGGASARGALSSSAHSTSLAGPLGANARDSAGVGREPAALKLVGDLALESEASRAVRDAEVAELALLRGEEAADSHRGFRLFRDVALRGRTLRLAKPVGGVTRVPRRGVVSLRYLELREVPRACTLVDTWDGWGRSGSLVRDERCRVGREAVRSPSPAPRRRRARARRPPRAAAVAPPARRVRREVLSSRRAPRHEVPRVARRTRDAPPPLWLANCCPPAGSHECYSCRGSSPCGSANH